ncbi:MAG: hypothetical protein KAR79_05780 [Simkaniaceae bacterium]|nr:hypothetical protein [Simkaniaceae bacterium]
MIAQPTHLHPLTPEPFSFTSFGCHLLESVIEAIKKIASIILSPYYFLFGEQENWLEEIPRAVHYNAFNGGYLSAIAQAARLGMQRLLLDLGGEEFTNSLANGTLPGWHGIQMNSIDPNTEYHCDAFPLSGPEIRNLADSLRISYDQTILNAAELEQILTHGSQSPNEQSLARGRMVSSLCASIRDSRGRPIKRWHAAFLSRIHIQCAKFSL